MKLTAKNLQTEYASVRDKMPQELSEQFDAIQPCFEFYGEDEQCTKAIDDFVEVANMIIAKTATKPETKTAKPKATPKVKPKKEPKAKPEPKSKKTAVKAAAVAEVAPEVRYLARYAKLHGKTLSAAREPARRLLAALQKDIVAKRIRKSSEHAADIMAMQRNLVKVISSEADGTARIEIADVERLREIGASQAVTDEVKLVRAFIALQGRTGVADKARRLLARIEASACKSAAIGIVRRALEDYVGSKTDAPEASAQELRGLYGLAGIEAATPRSGAAVSSTELLAAQFAPLPFTGIWARLIGKPTEPFRIMMYGRPGSGKSTLALRFAHYLAADMGRRVLYVSKEEGFGYTLQEKLLRLDAAHANLSVCDRLPSDLSAYDVVFVDSVNSLGLSPDDLQRLPSRKSFVYIFQSTKDGRFRGSQEFLHDVDTSIVVDAMKATTEKNRFGAHTTVRV